MKKLAVLFTTVLLFASCTQTKIGYVDIEEVMQDYDATKEMEAQLKIDQEEMNKSLDSIMLPFQAKVQEYYQNQSSMTTANRQMKEQELQQEQQMLQATQQQAQQILQQKGKDGILSLTKKIDSVVESYAIVNKYQMVLGTQGTGTVLYGEDQNDLTETIIDILNEEFENESE